LKIEEFYSGERWLRALAKGVPFFGLPGSSASGRMHPIMEKHDILARLREHETALKAQGVRHAALFGSRACGDARPDSDIDILVEIGPDIRMDVFKYVGIVHSIEDLFPVRVDVSNRIALKPHVKPIAEREAIYAF
jgi:predicted nucleotidyltransferase